MKILIADDSEIIQKRLIELVNSVEGITIIGSFTDTIKAKEAIIDYSPDVIIADIKMPGGGGLEIAKYLNSHNLSIKIIIYTNYPESTYLELAESLGIDHFFNKASDAQKLLETIVELKDKMLHI